MTPTYYVIDGRSFYATVECVARGMDPLKTDLVVADPERSPNTLCLAVSPSMKALGVKKRCRIRDIPGNIKYIVAPPRMQLYIDCAVGIRAKYGKNSILRGISYTPESTARERNGFIGGHKSGTEDSKSTNAKDETRKSVPAI